MKKTIALILVIILAFVFGCTEKKVTQKELEECYKSKKTVLPHVESCYKKCCEKKDFF